MSEIAAKEDKKLIYEVSIIRPIVILLLVFLHSFTKIASGADYQNDYQLCEGYKWLCWIISGFRIETIALVAGYIFAFQSLTLCRKYEFKPFIIKKFKRLIVPMLFFGIFYYICFFLDVNNFSLKDFFISIFSGCGHLWFLPMLFWCFIAIWVIDHFHLSSWSLLLILALLSILPMPTLHFGLAKLPHFLFYVYSGYFLWIYRDYLIKRFTSTNWLIAFWVLYLTIVVFLHAVIPAFETSFVIVGRLFWGAIKAGVGLIMSCVGVLALFFTVCHFTNKEGYRPKKWVIKASDYCYGVYVFHQFFLIWLYFRTPLVDTCNVYLIPWIGFIVSSVLSLSLVFVFLKTKIGKFLIG